MFLAWRGRGLTLTLEHMRALLARSASTISAAALTCLSLRRVVLLAAAISPARNNSDHLDELPSATLVVPAHNEASGIDRALAAIEALDYPTERLSVVLVDDGSTDATARQMREW